MARRQIAWALSFAALMLAAPWAVKQLLAAGVIDDPTLPKRLTMAIFGAFLAFSGNATPKMLTPLAQLRCDAGVVQTFQRFAGWTWVVTGLLYWLFLPQPSAQLLSMMVLLFGTAMVAVRLVRLKWLRPAR